MAAAAEAAATVMRFVLMKAIIILLVLIVTTAFAAAEAMSNDITHVKKEDDLKQQLDAGIDRKDVNARQHLRRANSMSGKKLLQDVPWYVHEYLSDSPLTIYICDGVGCAGTWDDCPNRDGCKCEFARDDIPDSVETVSGFYCGWTRSAPPPADNSAEPDITDSAEPDIIDFDPNITNSPDPYDSDTSTILGDGDY